jgi:hypothetical protein
MDVTSVVRFLEDWTLSSPSAVLLFLPREAWFIGLAL